MSDTTMFFVLLTLFAVVLVAAVFHARSPGTRRVALAEFLWAVGLLAIAAGMRFQVPGLLWAAGAVTLAGGIALLKERSR